jgi:EAL domain-containing protein (putative c-di-GMP-specific phosphodiesterase class I)
MNYLSSMGISLSIDDFGIGYSSLSILKRLPLNELKIDKSFINDISQSVDAATIAQTILLMGQNLGLHIVAEGVETKHQKEYLQKNGCEVFQGYLLGKPCRITDFEKTITEKELLCA